MISSNPTQKLLKDIGFTLLSEGKTIKVRAEGYSMYPSIKPGSIIYIEPLKEGETPPPGEIIAWKKETGLIVHRVARIIENEKKVGLITRGDSSLAEDPPLQLAEIAGRVVRIEDVKGRVTPPSAYSRMKNSYRFNRVCMLGAIYLKKFTRLAGRLIPVL
jgi:signal peptidase I